MQERALLIQSAGETVRVPLYEIRFMEVQKNYVTIHGMDDYSIKRTLREMQKELDGRFFQTHRSYIVNLGFVRKITKSDVVLKDGTTIPLARGLYDRINQAFINCF